MRTRIGSAFVAASLVVALAGTPASAARPIDYSRLLSVDAFCNLTLVAAWAPKYKITAVTATWWLGGQELEVAFGVAPGTGPTDGTIVGRTATFELGLFEPSTSTVHLSVDVGFVDKTGITTVLSSNLLDPACALR